MSDTMPKVTAVEAHWTPEMLAEFNRRRRSRNYLLLAAMGGFCIVIYAIACVKLHNFGQMW